MLSCFCLIKTKTPQWNVIKCRLLNDSNCIMEESDENCRITKKAARKMDSIVLSCLVFVLWNKTSVGTDWERHGKAGIWHTNFPVLMRAHKSTTADTEFVLLHTQFRVFTSQGTLHYDFVLLEVYVSASKTSKRHKNTAPARWALLHISHREIPICKPRRNRCGCIALWDPSMHTRPDLRRFSRHAV